MGDLVPLIEALHTPALDEYVNGGWDTTGNVTCASFLPNILPYSSRAGRCARACSCGPAHLGGTMAGQRTEPIGPPAAGEICEPSATLQTEARRLSRVK